MAYLFLILAFVANGLANVLLKIGADRSAGISLSDGVVRLVTGNLYLIGGVLLFAVNILFYVAALRAFPLSVAYPIMVGMSFLIATSAAAWFLNESIGWQHLLGYALIIGGITLVVGYAR